MVKQSPHASLNQSDPESERLLAQALSDSVDALVQTLRLEEVLDRIMDNVGRVVDSDGVSLMLLEDGEVALVRSRGELEPSSDQSTLQFRTKLVDAPILMAITQIGKPLIIPDTLNNPGWLDFPPTRWIRSYVGAPIHSQGETFGFLNLNCANPDAFSEEDANRLQIFAAQAAVAIRNARLFETVQRGHAQAALINEITTALNQPVEVPGILQTAVDRLAEALNVAYVGVALLDASGSKLCFVADHAVEAYSSLVGLELDITGTDLADESSTERKVFYINDVLGQPHSGVMYNFEVDRQAASLLAAPLVLHGRKIGVLGCAKLRDRPDFGPEEIRLMETVANLAAVRVEQARLLESARQNAAEMAALYAISVEISRQHGLSGVLQMIVDSSVNLLKAEGGKLFLCNAETQEVQCVTSSQLPEGESGEALRYGEGAAGKVAQSGQTLLIQNYAEWPGRAPAYEHRWKPATLLSVPMLWQDAVTGVIQVFRGPNQPLFQQADQDLLVLFASQAATALENSHLYERLQRQAITDELTSVYNRRGIFELGRREVERARRYRTPLAAILFDIDHFKQVNDRFGHAVGDQLLAALGKCCLASVREVDLVGRYGGEEFVVLLPQADLNVASQIAERIRVRVSQIVIPTATETAAQATISVGVTVLIDNEQELDSLLSRADNAMYAAKNAGRNQVVKV